MLAAASYNRTLAQARELSPAPGDAYDGISLMVLTDTRGHSRLTVRERSRQVEVATPPAPRRRRPGMVLLEPTPRTAGLQHAAAIATYLTISLVLWAHVWIGGDPARAITCNCGDTVQQVWWLEWLPWALSHGHNPLLSNAEWARLGGVNLLSNTSMFAPAALLAPVTLLFGPVASFNVANLLAPVLSGWAAFALAGRFSTRLAPRLLAGALFAFSPFMLRNTVLGHLDLTLAAYLPLTFLLGLRLLSRDGRPVRTGLWLGG